jgi:hypothetical protein
MGQAHRSNTKHNAQKQPNDTVRQSHASYGRDFVIESRGCFLSCNVKNATYRIPRLARSRGSCSSQQVRVPLFWRCAFVPPACSCQFAALGLLFAALQPFAHPTLAESKAQGSEPPSCDKLKVRIGMTLSQGRSIKLWRVVPRLSWCHCLTSVTQRRFKHRDFLSMLLNREIKLLKSDAWLKTVIKSGR